MILSPRRRAAAVVGAASLVVGASAWASRAVLDEVIATGARQRVAFVPGWQPLLAFTLVALLVAAGVARAVARRSGPGTIADLALPLFGLLLLVVPYLPGLPDWWPALQVLAGPAKWVVWTAVLGQLLWAAAPLAPGLARWATSRRLGGLTVAVALATAAAAGAGAARLTHTVLFPSGDEPHYLVIAQSLWRDGDLKIENNHTRGDYQEYFGRQLDPHYLTRGRDGEIYSIHPVGMPIAITPVFALGGYTLTVAVFILMGAVAAAVTWRWVADLTGAHGPATLAWAAIALSAPFLINTFTIYPEVPAALVMAAAMPLVVRPHPGGAAWHPWAVGTLAALLPWLSTKYAPMSAALVAVAVARRWWPLHRGAARAPWVGGAVPIVVPYGIGLAAWFAFFYAYWGTPLPQAPYGAMVQTSLRYTVFGVPGLLFDQEYGLLAYAPAYVLAGFGLWTMVRRPGPLRRVGLEVGLLFAALIVTVGAFRIWWGGSAAPARPLMSGLLLLMLPMAVQIGSAAPGSARRAGQHLLVWVGVALAVLLVVAEDGLLLANGRDGTSALLEWLSPRWPLWRLAPTFIGHEAGTALLQSLPWLTAVAAASWALTRRPQATRGAASLAAILAAVGGAALAVTLMAALPAPQPPLPDVDLRARARLPALDAFDHVTRPFAVRYRPLALDASTAIESTLTVGVTPGLRRQPQPVRVLHNGRFSLPAGNYRVVVQWAARDPLPAGAGATIALQVGRIGAPLTAWTVDPQSGGTWSETFWLPVDAGFVGFRGTAEVERSIDELRVEALDVVDQSARVATPQVLAAAAYGAVIVLFHDEAMYPERTGFWTTGERRARVTVACPGGCTQGVTLRVHSGKRPNHLRLSSHGWRHEADLRGEEAVTIPVPPAEGGVIELDTDTTTGFVPIDVDPTVRDRRYLGVWIEVEATSSEESR
ncbi:MAG: ArnT family glycosyltransferase [Vicinamibacterales bacterium]